MPPKRRTNNKKKNKNKGKFGHGRERRSTPSATAASNAGSKTGTNFKGKAPDFWKDLASKSKSNLGQAYQTVYSRYKKATKRFVDYMASSCPSEMTEANGKITASSLLAATDVMANTGHIMDRAILKDLKLAIRIRNRVKNSVYGGGDVGHQYFLNVLTYCWSVLNSLPKTAKNEKATATAEDSTANRGESENPFEALMEDSDDEEDIELDDDEEEEKMFPTEPVERPSLPSGPEPLTLEELMQSDERSDAILFLMSLDEIMNVVVQQYRTTVLKNFNYYRQSGIPETETAIVEELIEAAVATNMAIQKVQQLEQDLMVQHEYFTTPYRLLATLVLPEITEELTATVREHGSIKGCTERDVTIYLGDCMESCCRNPSDPCNKKEELIYEFCNKWQVDAIGVQKFEQYLRALQQLTTWEIPIGSEADPRVRAQCNRASGGNLPDSHTWIKNMPSIGEDRAIHHTLRLLQTFRDVINKTPENRGIQAVRNFFGRSPWRAGRVPGNKTRNLDELFMADILPNWVVMCRTGILGVVPELPFENELCPLLVLIREYVQKPKEPLTWSITFAMHAMLTAIVETEPIFDQLMQTSKSVFKTFFEQLEWARKIARHNPESIGDPTTTEQRSWWVNMMSVSSLENLGLDVFGDRTLWNPLCAGTIFSVLNYFGNFEGGTSMIDCQAQLRITLHLFHALLENGIVRRGQLPFLDMVYDSFRNCKAVWEGRSLPRKGEFVQRFWVSFGYNAVEARKMSEKAKLAVRERLISEMEPSSQRNTNRQLVSIEPTDISKSFRRICNRDFHDVVDKYHTPEQRRRSKHTDFYRLMVNTNDTLDAIEDERVVMALNLPSCSIIFEQFVNSLGRILQWEPLLQSGVRKGFGDQRQGFAFLYAQFLLGALDFAEDPLNYEFLQVPMGRDSSSFMSQYFGRLDPRNATWFQIVNDDSRKTTTTGFLQPRQHA